MNVKQKWNSEHYQQINVALPKELASAFKQHCMTHELSIAGEVARLMREDLAMPTAPKKKPKPLKQQFDTRFYRRKAIKNVIWQLEKVKAAEDIYQESMPEQLQESNAHGIEDAIATLDSVIEELSNIEIYPELPVRSKKRSV